MHLCSLKHVNVQLGKFNYCTTDVLLHPIKFFHRSSASCTHVSALLQALVAITPVAFQLQTSGGPSTSVVCDKSLPVTSYVCQWKPRSVFLCFLRPVGSPSSQLKTLTLDQWSTEALQVSICQIC